MGQTATSTSSNRFHPAPVLGAFLGMGALIILTKVSQELAWDPTRPIDTIAYVLAGIAILLAIWVTISGLVVAWAATTYIGSSLARYLARYAVPWLRKFAVSGVAGAMVVSGTLGSSLPSLAKSSEPAPVSRIIDLPDPIQDLLGGGEPRVPTEVNPPGSKKSPDHPPESKTSPTNVHRDPSRTTEVVVSAGDNLWDITVQHLANIGDTTPNQTRIADYWQRVIEENRESLVSGDPDLIYPGETIKLPPL